MDQEKRLAAFEKMLAAIEENYAGIISKMEALKAQGREKSATYRQLMGNKLMYKDILSLYELYGLREKER
ncbi:MAG: hypothetical protein SPF74_06450 [Candidatus Limivicinus sp.]|nr:hypothetical protein [Candidatus Limivicinus sp.]